MHCMWLYFVANVCYCLLLGFFVCFLCHAIMLLYLSQRVLPKIACGYLILAKYFVAL